jgi:hypothetical protein
MSHLFALISNIKIVGRELGVRVKICLAYFHLRRSLLSFLLSVLQHDVSHTSLYLYAVRRSVSVLVDV